MGLGRPFSLGLPHGCMQHIGCTLRFMGLGFLASASQITEAKNIKRWGFQPLRIASHALKQRGPLMRCQHVFVYNRTAEVLNPTVLSRQLTGLEDNRYLGWGGRIHVSFWEVTIFFQDLIFTFVLHHLEFEGQCNHQ